jgi:uncharacterized protein (DUF362 family)/Pyruvate/2-oxoacid:ferredoxin oxidoreductase delta subunit
MSKVAIKNCPDYSHENVKNAVDGIFSLLDLDKLIKKDKKVLLKVNLLLNFKPEKGVTTHPSVVKAVAEKVISLGAKPFIGDSSGGVGSIYEKIIKETGMASLGFPIVNLDENGMRKIDNPNGTVDPLYISNTVLNFDLVINLPKMKTHELTKMTCGIKNIFGCVPGLQKVRHHIEAPDAEDFSKALVDVFSKVRPAITIVDGIISMEGNGPSNGILRDTKMIIGSTDAVSVDAVCSKMMGFEPFDILTTKIADERNIGEGHLEHIEIVGDPMLIIKDFKHPDTKLSILTKMPVLLRHILSPLISQIRVRPKINNKKCVKCSMCVRSCPAKAIDGIKFKIDRKKCIMCFCCRELCRYDAVDMEQNIIWKILGKIESRLMS